MDYYLIKPRFSKILNDFQNLTAFPLRFALLLFASTLADFTRLQQEKQEKIHGPLSRIGVRVSLSDLRVQQSGFSLFHVANLRQRVDPAD